MILNPDKPRSKTGREMKGIRHKAQGIRYKVKEETLELRVHEEINSQF